MDCDIPCWNLTVGPSPTMLSLKKKKNLVGGKKVDINCLWSFDELCEVIVVLHIST